MGRYLSFSFCKSSVNRKLKSYCKIRYIFNLLRCDHHLTKAPVCKDSNRWEQLLSFQSLKLARNATFKRLKCSNRTTFWVLGDTTKDVKHLQIVRFYSSSNKEASKPDNPLGNIEHSQKVLHPRFLGEHFGQTFIRLSNHINEYFKKKDVVVLAKTGSTVVTFAEYPSRSQRRRQSHQSNVQTGEAAKPLKSNNEQENTGNPQGTSGLQLFHISSLATKFGESYSYVAQHINTVFPHDSTKVKRQDSLEDITTNRGTNRKLKKRKPQPPLTTNITEDKVLNVQTSGQQVTVEAKNATSNWEEGYQYFARHINNYFSAKGTKNELQKKTEQLQSAKSTSQTSTTSQQTSGSETRGLFHSSPSATNFGENYFQTSSHINHYFKGQSEVDKDYVKHLLTDTPPPEHSEKTKPSSFIDYLRKPTSAIPDLFGTYLKIGPMGQTSKSKSALRSSQAIVNKNIVLNPRKAEEVTYGIIESLGLVSSSDGLTACVEALNEHLFRYPSCKALIWQEKVPLTLLRYRRYYQHHHGLQAALRETLAMIGHVDPVKGRGIRVLSIDGGGTRGVVPLQVLKLLEDETGKKIHQLFDYICGVSTGAVLAFMLGLAHFSLEECADMYRRFGSEVFRQNPLVGTMKMGWSHSYYNTETWEAILQKKLGDRVLIATARDELCPKVSAVSAVVNWGTSPKAFVFRNYNHKPGSLSRYAGGSAYQMWQAVRASSAAPGYFQEFPLQSDIHQDGGILLNNPCALAVHESRLLWPKQHFQCVLSLGTGRYDNAKRGPVTSTSLRAKISNLISSATDTEGVHTLLDDLLAPDVYFRFNPMLSAVVSLDENRPGAMKQLHTDTQNYLERNQPKLARLCLVLGAERSTVSRTKDWMSERAWEMRQKFM
ncbi:calcium-independent phospholipase A2-gamma-like [Gouania willdenowi]|uniref:Calcium-independent phospholipase A2-gamma-like n=1 Tax=Gouania willdenowi TaxID=441366 RepID=A0A8C5D763_GOUWI|nr:calcium-independent phospholipase A2-gamma-like [Gouania willdenowi]